MFAEHALDGPGDGELLRVDDEVFAGWFERRPQNVLLLVLDHDGLPLAVTILLLDLQGFSAG